MSKARPIGAYSARRGWLHGQDARAKLWALLALTVATFVARPVWGLCVGAIVLAACSAMAHVSARSLARALRPAAVILLLALIANALVVDGSGDIALVGTLGLSTAGLVRGTAAVARIVEVVGFVCAVSATTTVQELSDALVRGLRPLGRLGVDVGALSMVVACALRFIPEAVGEFDRVERAQRARGARFDGGLVRRLKAYAAVLVPLVVALFRRADELAWALRMRGYDASGMTDLMGPLDRQGKAFIAGSVALALVVALV